MLSPIRQFIFKQHPLAKPLITCLRDIYFSIAADVSGRSGRTLQGPAALIAHEYGNLTNFLLLLSADRDGFTENLINVVVRITNYSYWAAPSCVLARACSLSNLNCFQTSTMCHQKSHAGSAGSECFNDW